MWAAKTMATGARTGTARGAGMIAGGRPAAATTVAGRDRAAKADPVPTADSAVRRGQGVRLEAASVAPKVARVPRGVGVRRENFAVRVAAAEVSVARAASAGRCARRSRA